MMSTLSIPFSLIRGGSSKGVFFEASDLPEDHESRANALLGALEGVGPGDLRQIDGLGGADSLTAKIAVVEPSSVDGVDLDFMFYQVQMGKGSLSTSQNCGNILAAVLPFALSRGLIEAKDGHTTATIRMLNSDSLCEVIVETPNRELAYEGPTVIDGVPGTGSPILCNYLDVAGATTGALLPTGQVVDWYKDIPLTCVDNGMPVILMKASDVGISGYETKAELDGNTTLKALLEEIRLSMGPKMNIKEVANKTTPKLTILSTPKAGGLVNTRTFIPHVCHAAIGVLGAVSVATGCVIPGSVAESLITYPDNLAAPLNIEHPSGSFDVQLTVTETDGVLAFPKSGVLRTARIIAKGEVFVPVPLLNTRQS